MKNKITLLLLICIVQLKLVAQNIGINATGALPHPSAMLDVSATNKGMLVPRMTSAQRVAIATPATGLLVYDITTKNFWFYNALSWVQLTSGAASNFWLLNGNNIYNNTGNVGIGTATPASRLHIIGNEASIPFRLQNKLISGYTGMHFHSSSGALMGQMGFANTGAPTFGNSFYAGSIANVPFILTTNNIERMRIANTGYTGIGTPAPTSRLHIVGNEASVPLRIQNNLATGYAGMQFHNSTGILMGHMGFANTNAPTFKNSFYAGSIGNAPFIFTTSNLERMRIDNTGNISIGAIGITPTPSALLDIKSTNKGLLIPRMTLAQRNLIALPATSLMIYQTNSTPGFYYYNGTAWVQLSTGGGTNSWSTAGSNIFNNNAGNVGIGTSNPTSKFTIQTPINTTGFTHIGGADSIIVTEGIGGVSASIGTITNHAFRIHTNGSGKFSVYPAGEVVVGPNATGAFGKFTVQTTNNTYGISHLGEAGNILATRMGGTSAGIGTFSNTHMRIFCNGISEIFIAAATGNVGIGTENFGTYKLAVNGSIRSKELVVETGWADYVFAKNYKLPSLDEVEKFIQQNKHLPNIPSAKEVEEKGLHLGDTQRRMMEKIEELTLYLIENSKEIDMLKKKILAIENNREPIK